MPRPALIVVSKVFLENLPQVAQSTGFFKVKFRCGTGAAETSARRSNSDGSAEWITPLEMHVPDADLPLIAVVMQQLKSPGGKWSMVPGGRFAGPAASAVPSVWLQSSPGPAGVSFAADVEVFVDGDADKARAPTRPAPTTPNHDAGSDQHIFHSTPTWPLDSWIAEPAPTGDGGAEQWSQRSGPWQQMGRSHSEGPGQRANRGIIDIAMLGLRAVHGMRGQSDALPAQTTFTWGETTAGAREQQVGAREQHPLWSLEGETPSPGLDGGYVHDAQFPPTVGAFNRARHEGHPGSPRFPPPVGVFTRSNRLDERLAEHEEQYPPPVGSFDRSRFLDESRPLEETLPSPQMGRAESRGTGSSASSSYTMAQEEIEEDFKDARTWGADSSWGRSPTALTVSSPPPPPPARPASTLFGVVRSMLRSRSSDNRSLGQTRPPLHGRRFSAVETSLGASSASAAPRRASAPAITMYPQVSSQATHQEMGQRPDWPAMPAMDSVTSSRVRRSVFAGGANERMARAASARTASARPQTASAAHAVEEPSASTRVHLFTPPSATHGAAAGIDPTAADEVELLPSRHRHPVRLGFGLKKGKKKVKRRPGYLLKERDARAGAPMDTVVAPSDDAAAAPHFVPTYPGSVIPSPTATASTVSPPTAAPASPKPIEPVVLALSGRSRKRSDSAAKMRSGYATEGSRGAALPQEERASSPVPPRSRIRQQPSARVVVTTATQQGATIPDSAPQLTSRRVPSASSAVNLLHPRRVTEVVSAAKPVAEGALSGEDYGDEEAEEESVELSGYAPATALGARGSLEDLDMGYSNMPEDALNSLVLQDSLPDAESRRNREVSRPIPLTPGRGNIAGPEGSGPQLAERSIAAPANPAFYPLDQSHPARNDGCQVPSEAVVGSHAGRRSGGERVSGTDPVVFSCFSPPTVSEGQAFALKVLAYLLRQRDDVLQDALKEGVKEAGVPGSMPIMRGKRVTVKLDLPRDIFEVMPTDNDSTGARLASHPPSVRDFVWTGSAAETEFKVGCKPGARAAAGAETSVKCGADIIEGSRVTRLSFKIKVIAAGDGARLVSGGNAQELDTRMESVRANVARIAQEDITFEGKLGEGVQGTTFAGTWNGKRVAIKRLAELPTPASSVSASAVSDLEHEATILSLLGHHPNIVDFYGLSTGGGGINAGSGSVDVVTKLEEGGSLAEVLGLNKSSGPKGRSRGWLSLSRKGSTSLPSLSEYDGVARATWARDIACGLANAHAAGVVHNDVACRNALLSRRGPGGSALLCDFGMSTLLRGEGVEAATLIDVGNGGSGRWPVRQMPPEALRPPHALSPVSDTYMFGTMLFEIFAEEKPFAGLDNREVVRLVREGKRLKAPPLLEHQGPTLKRIFDDCLTAEPSNRPSMESVVARLSMDSRNATMALW